MLAKFGKEAKSDRNDNLNPTPTFSIKAFKIENCVTSFFHFHQKQYLTNRLILFSFKLVDFNSSKRC